MGPNTDIDSRAPTIWNQLRRESGPTRRRAIEEESKVFNCNWVNNLGIMYAQRPIKGILANSVDQDQTPQIAASDQVLYCLH